jgi:hypothetical protein
MREYNVHESKAHDAHIKSTNTLQQKSHYDITESWKRVYETHPTTVTTHSQIKINHDKVAFFIPRPYTRFFGNALMLCLQLTDPLHTSLHYLFSPSSHLPSGHLYPFYSADFFLY